MANWAVVENDVIIEYHDSVPTNWRTISNFSAAQTDLSFMRSQGWYLIVHPTVDLDPETQEIASWNYSFNGTDVIATAVIRSRDPVITDAAAPVPLDQQILALIRDQLQQYQQAIDTEILASVDSMITQQDSAWRTSIRERIQQDLLARQRDLIVRELSENADFHTAVAQAIRDDLTMDMIYNRGNRIGEILTQQGWLTETLDLSELKQNIENMIMTSGRAMGTEFRRILDIHISNINAMIAVDEIGREEPADALDRLRLQRNKDLLRSDYTQAADQQARMTQDLRDRWAQYRQDLRDLPQRYIDNGGTITWPEAP